MMNKLKAGFYVVVFFAFLSCGNNDQSKNKASSTNAQIEVESNHDSNEIISEADSTNSIITKTGTILTDSKLESKSNVSKNNSAPKPTTLITEELKNKTTSIDQNKTTEKVMDSPLKIFLKQGEIGKSYTKKELIENFKFPKEAVDLVRKVTYTGLNTVYFNWGSTWLVEKVSDAQFNNGTVTFVFKNNKTYITGGAIGIKYNKKVYTELILNNGNAYIPSVKGFHWEINK
jgi:hypothetical protein